MLIKMMFEKKKRQILLKKKHKTKFYFVNRMNSKIFNLGKKWTSFYYQVKIYFFLPSFLSITWLFLLPITKVISFFLQSLFSFSLPCNFYSQGNISFLTLPPVYLIFFLVSITKVICLLFLLSLCSISLPCTSYYQGNRTSYPAISPLYFITLHSLLPRKYLFLPFLLLISLPHTSYY